MKTHVRVGVRKTGENRQNPRFSVQKSFFEKTQKNVFWARAARLFHRPAGRDTPTKMNIVYNIVRRAGSLKTRLFDAFLRLQYGYNFREIYSVHDNSQGVRYHVYSIENYMMQSYPQGKVVIHRVIHIIDTVSIFEGCKGLSLYSKNGPVQKIDFSSIL